MKPIEDKFAELGLEVERKGKTLFGNVHYQLRKELDHKVTKDDFVILSQQLDIALKVIFDIFADFGKHLNQARLFLQQDPKADQVLCDTICNHISAAIQDWMNSNPVL